MVHRVPRHPEVLCHIAEVDSVLRLKAGTSRGVDLRMREQAERDLVPVVFAAGADSPEMVPVDSDVARVTLSQKPEHTGLRGDPAVVRAIHTGLVLAAELRAEGRPLQGC